MLTNSLFLDFLLRNGLNVWKEESTRDIICIRFDYGVKSYKEEIKAIDKRIQQAMANDKLQEQERDNYIKVQNRLRDLATAHRNDFVKKTREQLREDYYRDGVDITYHTHNSQGEIIKTEVIHYQMLYRTPGKAKKGACMFICDRLYEKARNFLYMGIKLPKQNAPVVEIGAYSSLVTSTIVDRVKINPEEILVLDDVESAFNTNIISVELDENKHCVAVPKKDYTIKNTLFDGQALIDDSIFPSWGDGYILLRHHFCKMAAFRTNVQLFFQDYFGDKYETTVLKDYWGNEHPVKKIKLITTVNAMKWIKFKGIDYKYWSQWVYENDCMFGIVKTAHESKLGEVQRMSYQMVNALDMEKMQSICQCTVDYIMSLKLDDDEFLKFLDKNKNFSNDYEVLRALVNHNRDFLRSDYYRGRKKRIIYWYLLGVKNGKLIQNADNLVIVGSPYAMLLHSVGEDVKKDNTFETEPNAIQCYTERFDDGEYLAEFRSPFNSRNNLGYLHNHHHWIFDRYFKFGRQIIAINMIGTDAQDRNNGLIKWVSI